MRQAGIAVEVLAYRGAGNPINYWRAYWRMRAILSEGRIDLVHAQFGQCGLLVVGQRLVPTVVTYRGSDLQGIPNAGGRNTLKGWLLTGLSRIVARLADEVIVVSKHLARYLPARRYHIIPHGVDLDKFFPMPLEEARRRLALALDGRLVLFVGNPRNPVKRYELAQQAVALLHVDMKAELVVASGISHDQIPLWMNACNALVVTSWHEGSPNVVKEALACNLPVVSVDVGDVRELFSMVSDCVMCDDYRPETIAVALKRVLAREGCTECRQAVLGLEVRALTSKVIAVYKLALNRSKPSREKQSA